VALVLVWEARRRRVGTTDLIRCIELLPSAQPPVSPGLRSVRVLDAAKTRVAPPTFVVFTNVATKFHFSYERYLENQLREKYGFVGTPLRIAVRKRSRARSEDRKH
jgi:GTP-binding protein